jgi:hypothetical protein
MDTESFRRSCKLGPIEIEAKEIKMKRSYNLQEIPSNV